MESSFEIKLDPDYILSADQAEYDDDNDHVGEDGRIEDPSIFQRPIKEEIIEPEVDTTEFVAEDEHYGFLDERIELKYEPEATDEDSEAEDFGVTVKQEVNSSDSDSIRTESVNAEEKGRVGRSEADAAKETFCCHICRKSFTRKRYLTTHLRTHAAGEKPHECQVCQKVFSSRSNLKKHAMIHAADKPFLCKACGRSFNQKVHLKTHVCSQSEAVGPYKCQLCPRSFLSPKTLKYHTRNHTRAKPHRCQVCPAAFTCAKWLLAHNSTHTGEKPFKCQACDMAFALPPQLARHNRTHTGEKPYECKVCEKNFSQISSLEYHVRARHGDANYKFERISQTRQIRAARQKEKQLFACPICRKEFTSKHYLNDHVRIHAGEKPYECPVCNKGFASEHNLKIHSVVHVALKPFHCDVCGKEFSRKTNLESHRLIHSDARPHKCELCQKTFISLVRFEMHARNHARMRPHKCPVCQETFSHQKYLIFHRRIHTGEQPRKCPVCDEDFTCYGSLRRHIRQAHPPPAHPSRRARPTQISSECEGSSESSRNLLTPNISAGDNAGADNPDGSFKSVAFSAPPDGAKTDSDVVEAILGQEPIVELKVFEAEHQLLPGEQLDTGEEAAGSWEDGALMGQMEADRSGGEMSFSCHVCRRSYDCKSDLDSHLLSHAKKKPHDCQLCEKAFVHASGLKRHMRIHTGEKPYKCRWCDKVANQSFDLLRHAHRIHPQEIANECDGSSSNYFFSAM